MNIERFSLILLEPGEIYFEDYLIYYHHTTIKEQTPQQTSKGKLRICSKSLVFEPVDLNLPLIKFPFKSIESIYDFIDEPQHHQQLQSLTTIDSQQLRKQFFYIKCKQLIKLKENNKIAPYQIERTTNTYESYYFQLIFTNVNDLLQLIRQLHRASTLPYDQEEMMINLMVKSRLLRIKFDLTHLIDVYNEQIMLEFDCYKINPLCTNPGKIILTNMCVYYKAFNNLESETVIKIKINLIKFIIKRRYKLKREIACEILIDNDDNKMSLNYLYLAFDDCIKCNEFYAKLKQLHSDIVVSKQQDSSQENMLQKWRYGLISNYDYLLYLNSLADRSFNDLTQYPVFPWVICDYKSANLDLNDETIYRDLTKPIGALNPQRLERLKQRYNDIKSGNNDENKFLYGSHYSTPAFVLYYLVREYPEWQLCLQNGKFDQPDRLFHSIGDTWRNCYTCDSDVKELIPQFYDIDSSNCGQFLLNYLKLDFGMRQDNVKVDDVQLPRWCKSDPKKFVQMLRDALESQYVSKNLHSWIDLIFGYKQRGELAEKYDNLFYYLCYEGAIDLDKVKDPNERKCIEIQIQEFGQIPTQLFKQAHPQRAKFDPLDDNLPLNVLNEQESNQTVSDSQQLQRQQSIKPMGTKSPSPDELLSQLNKRNSPKQPKLNTKFKQIQVKHTIKQHKSVINDCCFVNLNNHNNNVSQLPYLCSVSNDNWLKLYSIEEHSIYRSHNVNNFSLSSIDYIQFKIDDKNLHTLLILSCWDNSIYVYDINYSRCIYTLNNAHEDAVTCLKILNRDKINYENQYVDNLYYSYYLFSSSWDSIIKIWKLTVNSSKKIDLIKINYFSELLHDISILHFDLSANYLASICDDGNLLIWKLQQQNQASLSSSPTNSTDSSGEANIGAGDQTQLQPIFHYLISNKAYFGDITDCKICEDNENESDNVSTTSPNSSSNKSATIAFCTNQLFIKIFNLITKSEMFSLNLAQEQLKIQLKTNTKLTRLLYTHDYIITSDSSGYLYLIDLKQTSSSSTNNNGNNTNLGGGSSVSSNSFLSNYLKLNDSISNSSINCLALFDDSILSAGDSDGNLYILSFDDI